MVTGRLDEPVLEDDGHRQAEEGQPDTHIAGIQPMIPRVWSRSTLCRLGASKLSYRSKRIEIPSRNLGTGAPHQDLGARSGVYSYRLGY